jgi:hypothetical protein
MDRSVIELVHHRDTKIGRKADLKALKLRILHAFVVYFWAFGFTTETLRQGVKWI